jgi:uncharacterized lipoprotein
MNRLVFIIFAVMIIALAGCSVNKQAVSEQQSQPAQSSDQATSAAISETEGIEQLQDPDAEKQLDDAGNSLSNW